MEKYKYELFGIPILSEIRLLSLISVETIDNQIEPILVRLSTNSFGLQNKYHSKPFTKFSEEEFFYSFPEVIEFYVLEGKEIWIRNFGSSLEDGMLYFFSNALPAALFQRNKFLIHASGVVVDDKVVLFSAPSRTGKSSLALQLQQMGYPVFTDDNVMLSIENDQIVARAAYPYMKAWENTLMEIEGASQLKTFTLQTNYGKKGLHIDFDIFHKKYPVQQIVFLKEEGEKIWIRSLGPIDLIQKLIENTYRNSWIQPMKKGGEQFTYVSNLINYLQGFEATRPRNKITFKEFAQLIVEKVF